MTTAIKKPVPMRRGGYYWVRDEQGVSRPLVSVTEVLNEVAKQDFFVPAAIRKAHAAWSADPEIDVKQAQATWYQHMGVRANVGKMMHSFYEAHARGAVLDINSLPEADRGHAHAFLKWFDAVGPEIIQVEATVANPTYGYAGTGDLWAKIGGEIAIIDYKTGFLDEFSCAMQESAYRMGEFGINKATGEQFALPEVTAMYALQTRDDSTYQWVQLPDRFDDFRAYLHAWKARKRAERKVEPCFASCFCQQESKTDPAYITVCRECSMPEDTVHLSDCQFSVFRNFDGP